jgi:hypothetical protein
MAYVFSGINQALAGQSDEEQKQDIFNAEPAVSGDGGGQPLAQGDVKTSTEGELGDSGAAAANAGSSEQEPQQVDVQNAEVVRKNVGKVKAPKGIDRVKADLDTAEQGVQTEADNYMKSWENKDYTLDNKVLDQAADGDDKAYETAANRISQNADRVDQFDTKTDYDVEDTDLLRSDAGVQELMRRESDTNYNGGESAFDMMLLRRNKDFNALRDNLVNRQDGLRKTVDGYRTDKTEAAQKAVDTNFGKATDNIKSYLDTAQGSQVAEWKRMVAEEDAARDALRAQGGDKAFMQTQAKAAIDALVQEYQATGDPQALEQIQYLQDAGVDASQFYGVGRDLDAEKDYAAVVDDKGASKFNRIMALLGRGDSLQAGAGLGERQGFDTSAFREATVGKAQKELTAARAAKAEAERVAKEEAEKAAREEEQRKAAAAGFGGAYDAGKVKAPSINLSPLGKKMSGGGNGTLLNQAHQPADATKDTINQFTSGLDTAAKKKPSQVAKSVAKKVKKKIRI